MIVQCRCAVDAAGENRFGIARLPLCAIDAGRTCFVERKGGVDARVVNVTVRVEPTSGVSCHARLGLPREEDVALDDGAVFQGFANQS